MNPLTIVGLGAGIIGGLGNLFGGRKARREMDAVMKLDPRYQVNPIAQERYGFAKTLLNARMPGAINAERNIMASQANQLANINRGSTDATQALMLASGAQGQTNDAFQQLAGSEAQDYYNRVQNLTGAQQGMIAEGDKVYQDDVRRWENKANAAGAKIQSRAQQWQGLSSLGFGVANFGLSMDGKNTVPMQAGGTAQGGMSPQAMQYLPLAMGGMRNY